MKQWTDSGVFTGVGVSTDFANRTAAYINTPERVKSLDVTGKTIAVVGGAGMIGTHVCEILLARGATVIVLDNFSNGEKRLTHQNLSYVNGDARNFNTCTYVFQRQHAGLDVKPVDAVMNLAANVAGVLYNTDHNLEMFYDNVALQTVPLMAAGSVGVKHFLQVSSICVYSEEEQAAANEEAKLRDEPTLGNYGYSWAKRMGERMAMVSDIERVVVVRPTNCYGIHDYFDRAKSHVIPAVIRKVVEDDVILMHGGPAITREFIFAEDAAEGMVAALEYGVDRNAYNLGTGGDTAVSLKQLVGMVKSILNVSKDVYWSVGNTGDVHRSTDSSKAALHLGWRYKTNLGKGLKEVIKAWKSSQSS